MISGSFITERGAGRTEGTSNRGAGIIGVGAKYSTEGSTCLTGVGSKTGTTLSLGDGGKNCISFSLEVGVKTSTTLSLAGNLGLGTRIGDITVGGGTGS
jgi:hypothetical protein